MSGPCSSGNSLRTGVAALSFELSTVGWLATRTAGHFATGDTRIDHLVEAIRALSYAGT